MYIYLLISNYLSQFQPKIILMIYILVKYNTFLIFAINNKLNSEI